MKCKSKTVRGARLIAVVAAVVLCSLCVCFVSCSEEADEEEDVYTTYNADTSESGDTSEYIYATLVARLSYLSDGCTIVPPPLLTSTQLEDFVTELKNTSLSGVTLDMSYMTITKIEEELFYECTNITSVKTIEPYAFYCCTNLVSVTIAEGTTAIRERAFYGCSSLTEMTIPDSVT